jgi:hypothetical protein
VAALFQSITFHCHLIAQSSGRRQRTLSLEKCAQQLQQPTCVIKRRNLAGQTAGFKKETELAGGATVITGGPNVIRQGVHWG